MIGIQGTLANLALHRPVRSFRAKSRNVGLAALANFIDFARNERS